MYGWLLCKDKIDHFEHLIVENGYNDSYYPKSQQAESSWQQTTRTVTKERTDAASTAPGIGDDGSSAGYTIKIDLTGLTSGKTYKIYVRAITKGGDACLFHSFNYTAP